MLLNGKYVIKDFCMHSQNYPLKLTMSLQVSNKLSKTEQFPMQGKQILAVELSFFAIC